MMKQVDGYVCKGAICLGETDEELKVMKLVSGTALREESAC